MGIRDLARVSHQIHLPNTISGRSFETAHKVGTGDIYQIGPQPCYGSAGV